MKYLLNLIASLTVSAFIINSAVAGCYTGFACSLEDLEKIEQQNNKEFIFVLNKFFNKSVKEPVFLANQNNITNYRDLFIFNTIV